MDSIDIIKPLSTVLGSAVNKSRKCQESNLGPLDAMLKRYPMCYAPPHFLKFLHLLEFGGAYFLNFRKGMK